jgi:hypothetical protein
MSPVVDAAGRLTGELAQAKPPGASYRRLAATDLAARPSRRRSGGPSARFGSSSAPQIEQPTANIVTRSPQLGQTWGPDAFIPDLSEAVVDEGRLRMTAPQGASEVNTAA